MTALSIKHQILLAEFVVGQWVKGSVTTFVLLYLLPLRSGP